MSSFLLKHLPASLSGRSMNTRAADVGLSLPDTAPVHTVDRHYLSYSIDISVLAGGLWWEGSSRARRGLGAVRVPPIDLKRKKLDRLVQALGPAYLRVGGSEADKIHYFDKPADEPDSLLLRREKWDELHAFIQRNNLLFAFTVKYGLFKRRHHGGWEGAEFERLLRHSVEKGHRLDVCELGNELNAYWAFHGLGAQPGPKKLAYDYRTFARVVKAFYPDARILGPGSAFWPRLGETIKPFTNITPGFLSAMQGELDIVDWHYYPFQSARAPVRTRTARAASFTDPRTLDDFARYSTQLRGWRDAFQPQAQIWTGESGSAQCGGEPGISDRWASCFWWADQLGNGARQKQSVMVRQSLIGGDYGMIDRRTLKPRPDYWLSWIWQKCMGQEVYEIDSPCSDLRVYCQSAANGRGVCLLLINLAATTVHIKHLPFARAYAQYELAAKSLSSRKLRINGRKPRFNKGRFSLQDVPELEKRDFVLPHTINFWLFDT